MNSFVLACCEKQNEVLSNESKAGIDHRNERTRIRKKGVLTDLQRGSARCITATVIAIFCTLAVRRPANAMETYRMSADRIAFYTNRFILQGIGNVHLDIGGGRVITADFFSMDIHGNRFIVAGDVHLEAPNISDSFVALSADLVAQQAYAIADNDTLQRLAFTGNDFSHPRLGIRAPDGAFELPLIADPATKLGRRIVIGTRNYIRYGSCTTQLIGGAGLYIPVPDCYINTGDDPNLTQSALAGSNLGGEINLTGSANAISGVFINYDKANGLYVALQQNVSSPKAWAALGLIVSGHPGLSLIGAATPSDAFGVRVSTQLQSLATISTSPVTGFRYSDIRIAEALPFGYAELFASSESDSGTGPSFLPSRPFSAQLDFVSPNVQIGKSTFGAIRFGYGEQHDPYGVQQLGNMNYTTLGFGYFNAALTAPAITIGGPDPRRRVDLSALASETIQRFSNPHETSTATTAVSLAKSLGPTTVSFSYTVASVADRYSDQYLAYPTIVPQNSGVADFDGFATFRTLALGATVAATPQLNASLAVRVHDDFPKPTLDLFPVVTAAPLGQNPYPYQLGQPPVDVTLAFRLRINPQLSLDITDTQFINAHGWPTNTFQFLLRP